MKTKKIYEWSQQFLIEVDDYTNQRDKLKIVNPNLFLNFIKFVVQLNIKTHLKVCLIIQLISGARISEVLSLHKGDINWTTGEITMKVLKKNRLAVRFKNQFLNLITKLILLLFPFAFLKAWTMNKEARIKSRFTHIPMALMPYLWQEAEGKANEQLLFDYTGSGTAYRRESAYKQYEKLFGLNTHAIRHSRITYFRITEEKSIDWIKDVFFFSDHKTIYRYINRSSSLETKQEADKLDLVFKIKKSA